MNNAWIQDTKYTYSDMFMKIHPCNFECGVGWKDIINKLCADIHALDPTVTVVQIKQKFGTLRFYLGTVDANSSHAVYALVSEAEEKSAITCEWCGLPGSTDTSKHWHITLCPSCSATRKLHFLGGGL